MAITHSSATPSPPRRRREPAYCPPHWAWLFTGVLIGIFLSFLFFLRTVPEKGITPAAEVATTTTKSPTPQAGISSTPQTPRFEFYDVLPKQNAGTPTNPTAPATNTNPASSVPPSEVPAAVTLPAGTDTAIAPTEAATQFSPTMVVQVGAFRDMREAEGLRTHLSQLGINAFIQQITLNNNDRWHRVRVGPFRDLDHLNSVRAQLNQHNVSSMIIP